MGNSRSCMYFREVAGVSFKSRYSCFDVEIIALVAITTGCHGNTGVLISGEERVQILCMNLSPICSSAEFVMCIPFVLPATACKSSPQKVIIL